MISYGASQFTDIDDFVGTDFWVRARITIPRSYTGVPETYYCYINVVNSKDIQSEHGYVYTLYDFRYINIKLLSRGDVYHCNQEAKDKILNRVVENIKGYNITLFKPLEVATTNELFYIDK
jgi:hypothetical protein